MVDIEQPTSYYTAARIFAIFTSLWLLMYIYFAFAFYWLCFSMFWGGIGLFLLVVEILSDGYGPRNYVGPATKALMYAIATLFTLPLCVSIPFFTPFGYLITSSLYFTDYRKRRRFI